MLYLKSLNHLIAIKFSHLLYLFPTCYAGVFVIDGVTEIDTVIVGVTDGVCEIVGVIVTVGLGVGVATAVALITFFKMFDILISNVALF
jgi:hypothetical protein